MCLFCRIANHQAPATIVHEDDDVVAFRDIRPQAPTHVLVIPRKHIRSLDEAQQADEQLLGKVLRVASKVARDERLEAGYRLVVNTGPAAGQTVFHIHAHVIGGRSMHWPPG